jgi:hypothetical protein
MKKVSKKSKVKDRKMSFKEAYRISLAIVSFGDDKTINANALTIQKSVNLWLANSK